MKKIKTKIKEEEFEVLRKLYLVTYITPFRIKKLLGYLTDIQLNTDLQFDKSLNYWFCHPNNTITIKRKNIISIQKINSKDDYLRSII